MLHKLSPSNCTDLVNFDLIILPSCTKWWLSSFRQINHSKPILSNSKNWIRPFWGINVFSWWYLHLWILFCWIAWWHSRRPSYTWRRFQQLYSNNSVLPDSLKAFMFGRPHYCSLEHSHLEQSIDISYTIELRLCGLSWLHKIGLLHWPI